MDKLLEIQAELDEVNNAIPEGLYLKLCSMIKKQYDREMRRPVRQRVPNNVDDTFSRIINHIEMNRGVVIDLQKIRNKMLNDIINSYY